MIRQCCSNLFLHRHRKTSTLRGKLILSPIPLKSEDNSVRDIADETFKLIIIREEEIMVRGGNTSGRLLGVYGLVYLKSNSA